MSERFFSRILIPIDGSESAGKAARYGIRLACGEGCEIFAVHVVDEESANDFARYADRPLEAILDRMKRSGAACLEEVKELGREKGVSVVGEVLVGVPHQVILTAAQEKKADLIVMGKVGRKGPRRVLIGSVTERVIAHSAIPVLVVK